MSNKTVDNDWRNLLYTELKRTGGDPSFLFEILEGIMEQRAWETLLDEDGNPVGSLRRLIEAPLPVGCGQKAEKVLRLLRIEHRYEDAGTQWKDRMEHLRNAVERELGNDVEIGTRKDNQYSSAFDISKANIAESTGGGTSKSYRIAVLKRDAPDIAERVINNELSAAAGMRELGIRNGEPEELRRAVNMLDAKSTLNSLIKFMPDDVLNELIDLLIEWKDTP